LQEANNNFSERRKFLRLNAQVVGQPTCHIPVESGKVAVLALTDICPGGFGATIPEYLGKHFLKASEFCHCQIDIQGLEDVSVRIVDVWRLRSKAGEVSTRAGFEFTSEIDWLRTGLQS
jgi:hypothetical protein